MKILMATMGLDIGGAETHIVELAKELVSGFGLDESALDSASAPAPAPATPRPPSTGAACGI